MNYLRPAVFTVVFFLGLSAMAQTRNPLRVSTTNPRYFTDNSGKAIFLTGSNSGDELEDDAWNVPNKFNFNDPNLAPPTYLNFLAGENHNYIRAFVVEHSRFDPVTNPDFANVLANPMPYKRTGPGFARDRELKFTVDSANGSEFNPAYFLDRLQLRASQAGSRNPPIYMGVMLFQGFSIRNTVPPCDPISKQDLDSWFGHPYNVANNVNNVDGDPPPRTEQGLRLLTYGDPNFATINRLQDAYVQHVVQTVSALDNVLYEIINEPPRCPSDKLDAWERHIIQVIRAAEPDPATRHPILRSVYGPQGLSNQCPQNDNSYLFANSPPNPDAISPGLFKPDTEDYAGSANGPPASDGTRVIISDTDHLWGDNPPDRPNPKIPGATNDPPFSDQPVNWVWKSLTRGMGGAVFLDPDVVPTTCNINDPCACVGGPIDTASRYAPIRQAMGDALAFARKIDLINMTPQSCSNTGYCLAEAPTPSPGTQFLAYAPMVSPNDPTIRLTLIGATMGDRFDLTWFNPVTRDIVSGDPVIAPANNETVPVTVPTSPNGTVWAKAVACLAKSATTFTCPTQSNLRPRR